MVRMNQAGRTETAGVAASEDTSYQFARPGDLDICSHKGVELDGRVVVNELEGEYNGVELEGELVVSELKREGLGMVEMMK